MGRLVNLQLTLKKMLNLSHYEEHYKTLDLPEDCSWDELRKSYKRQIQLNHPDRLTDDSPDKEEAQERIKSLNLAYQDLSKYYKAHDSLPRFDTFEATELTSHEEHEEREAFTFDPIEPSIPAPTKPHKNNRKIILSLILITTIATYLLLDKDDFEATYEENQDKYKSAQDTSLLEIKPSKDSVTTSNSPTNKQNNPALPNRKKKYFTVGSSVGKVMDAQGIPDKNTDSVWYYGKSTITFENGKVASWYRHKDTPLNIDIAIK